MTWTRGASPYVSTCDLEVPVGSTLTMEPGVEVKLGPRHKLSVAGRLLAVGSEALPISFKPASSEWDSVQLLAGSGPSEIAYASFTGGGAGRREMLGIAADQADLHHSSFLAGSGVGVEVKAGAAPTLRYNRFGAGCTVSQALPPAALRLQKGARPVVKGNYFLRNVLAMQMDASASPSLDGNRFDYNGHNGVSPSPAPSPTAPPWPASVRGARVLPAWTATVFWWTKVGRSPCWPAPPSTLPTAGRSG